jgi:3-methyladenine DNA glycosylase AlkC
MAVGDLTRHFGGTLVDLLAGRLRRIWPAFDRKLFERVIPELDSLTLMRRISRIAEVLVDCLPREPAEAWRLMAQILPSPLDEAGKIFNDGYWMLPLAAYWPIRCQTPSDGREVLPSLAFDALAELTQRGTAEFAIRPLIRRYPVIAETRIAAWSMHPSFHVRRLASEGTRPYLPWGGRLAVNAELQLRFLDMIRPLARDQNAYVRRSVGNHVRDWRRLDPDVADRWVETVDPPPDVRRLALRPALKSPQD